MKLTALAVVILALGIVVGFALAEGSLGGPASAIPKCPGPSSQCATPTPTPSPQQREDQITIFAPASNLGVRSCGSEPPVYATIPITSCPPRPGQDKLGSIELAARDYPSTAAFRLEVTELVATNTTLCFRLYDSTADQPVPGSEICRSNASSSESLHLRVRTDPLTLSIDSHEYVVQGRGSTGFAFAARIIVEWTE